MTSSLNSIVEKAKYLTVRPPRTMIKIKTAGKFDHYFDFFFSELRYQRNLDLQATQLGCRLE